MYYFVIIFAFCRYKRLLNVFIFTFVLALASELDFKRSDSLFFVALYLFNLSKMKMTNLEKLQ